MDRRPYSNRPATQRRIRFDGSKAFIEEGTGYVFTNLTMMMWLAPLVSAIISAYQPPPKILDDFNQVKKRNRPSAVNQP